MTSSEYIILSGKTAAPDKDYEAALINVALGLTGEAGEIADLIKKWTSQGHKLNYDKLQEEVGDLMWYIAKLCRLEEWTFESLWEENINKLSKRYGESFSVEKSVNRNE